MGCVSSAFLDGDSDDVHVITHHHHHIVSLTSTTYGLLASFDPPKSPDASDRSDPAGSKGGGGGGEAPAVLYTTTLRAIRKTFEDCNAARSALRAAGVAFKERDISMDLGFREELRGLAGGVGVPQLFVRGRRVGGLEAATRASGGEGGLAGLMEGVPRAGDGGACGGCGGVGFLNCFACRGGRKVVAAGGGEGRGAGRVVRCGECNENGLVLCPVCS